jgi:hypothetical protein
MDDELVDATGKRKRHDGRDPWAVVSRERVLAEAVIREAVPGRLDPIDDGALAVGAMILIVLERLRNDPQGRYESVWCEVTAVDGEVIDAVLDNQPTWIRGISSGDPIQLTRDGVLRVSR